MIQLGMEILQFGRQIKSGMITWEKNSRITQVINDQIFHISRLRDKENRITQVINDKIFRISRLRAKLANGLHAIFL